MAALRTLIEPWHDVPHAEQTGFLIVDRATGDVLEIVARDTSETLEHAAERAAVIARKRHDALFLTELESAALDLEPCALRSLPTQPSAPPRGYKLHLVPSGDAFDPSARKSTPCLRLVRE